MEGQREIGPLCWAPYLATRCAGCDEGSAGGKCRACVCIFFRTVYLYVSVCVPMYMHEPLSISFCLSIYVSINLYVCVCVRILYIHTFKYVYIRYIHVWKTKYIHLKEFFKARQYSSKHDTALRLDNKASSPR